MDFGWSVALSSSGDTLVVGARNKLATFYVYRRVGAAWSGGPVSPAATATGMFFGRDVSVSSDGKVAAIGWGGSSPKFGGLFVFVESGGSWLQLGRKTIIKGTGGRFRLLFYTGTRVALSGDGRNLALAGPEFRKLGAGYVGASLAFARESVQCSPLTSRYLSFQNDSPLTQLHVP